VLHNQAKIPEALESYRAALAIRERLAKADPGNALWQRALSTSHNKIGDILRAKGDLKAALEFLSRARGDPGLIFLASLEKLADVRRVGLGDFAEALESYRVALAIRERLAKADPSNAGWQQDLSTSHFNIGDVLVAQNKLTPALKDYRTGLSISERLAEADPGNADWQRELSVSHNKIGDALRAQGNLTQALESYRAALTIMERLVNLDSHNPAGSIS